MDVTVTAGDNLKMNECVYNMEVCWDHLQVYSSSGEYKSELDSLFLKDSSQNEECLTASKVFCASIKEE